MKGIGDLGNMRWSGMHELTQLGTKGNWAGRTLGMEGTLQFKGTLDSQTHIVRQQGILVGKARRIQR